MKNLKIIFLIFLPNLLFANAGTALIWAGYFHLYYGNFVIALFESIFLYKKHETYNFLIVLILLTIANYCSMLIGYFFTGSIAHLIGSDLFNPGNIEYYFQNILIYLSLTLASILVEFPFYKFAIKNSNYRISFRISRRINIISSIVVIILYIVFQLYLVKQ